MSLSYAVFTGRGPVDVSVKLLHRFIRSERCRQVRTIRREKKPGRSEWYLAIGLDEPPGARVPEAVLGVAQRSRLLSAVNTLISEGEIISFTTDSAEEELSTLSYLLEELRSAGNVEDLEEDDVALGEEVDGSTSECWDKLLGWVSWQSAGTVAELGRAAEQLGVTRVDPGTGCLDPPSFLVANQLHLLGHIELDPVRRRWRVLEAWSSDGLLCRGGMGCLVGSRSNAMQLGQRAGPRHQPGQPSIIEASQGSCRTVRDEELVDALPQAIDCVELLQVMDPGSLPGLEVISGSGYGQAIKRCKAKGIPSFFAIEKAGKVLAGDLKTIKFLGRWWQGERPVVIYREEGEVLDIPLDFPWPRSYQRVLCCCTGVAPRLAVIEGSTKHAFFYRFRGVSSCLVTRLAGKLEARVEGL